MKKLLTALALAVLAPISSMAISLADIQNNSDEYVLVSKNPSGACYVDSYSIASLRYDPPYYAMQSKVYLVSYTYNSIIENTFTATYNYNRCMRTLFAKEKQNHPEMEKNDILKLLWQDINYNNGMTGYLEDTNVWTFDGNFIGSSPNEAINAGLYLAKLEGGDLNPDITECSLGSAQYHIANYMFYKGYEEYFMPKLDSKNLY